MGLVGLYLRLRLDETPRFRALQRVRDVAQWPVGEALRAYPGRMLTGFVLVAAASLTFNTLFIFLPNQLVAELGVPLPRALAGALLGLAVMAAIAPALVHLRRGLGGHPGRVPHRHVASHPGSCAGPGGVGRRAGRPRP
jgi:hypothetical protein